MTVSAKLQGRESGTSEARRIAYKQIAAALAALSAKRPSDSSIHAARKAIKKARALWRLLQDALPAATYREVNARLRDAGRPLGAARDAKILVVALDRLLKAYGRRAAPNTLQAFRRSLVQNGSAIKHALMCEPTGIALSRHALRRVCQQVRGFSVSKGGWSVLGKGLRRTYARGRRMYRKACSDRRAEHLHEWRKQVKYLHNEIAILKPLWRGPIGKLASATGRLSEQLGDDHDLAVLCSRVLAQRGTIFSAAQAAKIVALIDRERAGLQDAACTLGARIYEEKAAAFAARFGGYWDEWRRTKTKAQLS